MTPDQQHVDEARRIAAARLTVADWRGDVHPNLVTVRIAFDALDKQVADQQERITLLEAALGHIASCSACNERGVWYCDIGRAVMESCRQGGEGDA